MEMCDENNERDFDELRKFLGFDVDGLVVLMFMDGVVYFLVHCGGIYWLWEWV